MEEIILRYLAYCKGCEKLKLINPTSELTNCDACGSPFVRTNVSEEEWNSKTREEKEELVDSVTKRTLRFAHYSVFTRVVTFNSDINEFDEKILNFKGQFYLGYNKKDWDRLSKDNQSKSIAKLSNKILSYFNKVVVTTGDWHEPYEIIRPVYYSITNRGLFSNEIDRKAAEYRNLSEAVQSSLFEGHPADFGFLYGNFDVGSSQFSLAFNIAVEELKMKALMMGADAVICMRQDIDIETEHINNFYLQMYGTAIKFKK